MRASSLSVIFFGCMRCVACAAAAAAAAAALVPDVSPPTCLRPCCPLERRSSLCCCVLSCSDPMPSNQQFEPVRKAHPLYTRCTPRGDPRHRRTLRISTTPCSASPFFSAVPGPFFFKDTRTLHMYTIVSVSTPTYIAYKEKNPSLCCDRRVVPWGLLL